MIVYPSISVDIPVVYWTKRNYFEIEYKIDDGGVIKVPGSNFDSIISTLGRNFIYSYVPPEVW